jgi:hypothetical protein
MYRTIKYQPNTARNLLKQDQGFGQYLVDILEGIFRMYLLVKCTPSNIGPPSRLPPAACLSSSLYRPGTGFLPSLNQCLQRVKIMVGATTPPLLSPHCCYFCRCHRCLCGRHRRRHHRQCCCHFCCCCCRCRRRRHCCRHYRCRCSRCRVAAVAVAIAVIVVAAAAIAFITSTPCKYRCYCRRCRHSPCRPAAPPILAPLPFHLRLLPLLIVECLIDLS